jgi:hypothetical protein
MTFKNQAVAILIILSSLCVCLTHTLLNLIANLYIAFFSFYFNYYFYMVIVFKFYLFESRFGIGNWFFLILVVLIIYLCQQGGLFLFFKFKLLELIKLRFNILLLN